MSATSNFLSSLAGDLTLISCDGPSGVIGFTNTVTATYTITPNKTCSEITMLTSDLVCIDSANQGPLLAVSENENAIVTSGQHSYGMVVPDSIFKPAGSTYGCFIQYHALMVCNGNSGTSADRLCRINLQGAGNNLFPKLGVATKGTSVTGNNGNNGTGLNGPSNMNLTSPNPTGNMTNSTSMSTPKPSYSTPTSIASQFNTSSVNNSSTTNSQVSAASSFKKGPMVLGLVFAALFGVVSVA